MSPCKEKQSCNNNIVIPQMFFILQFTSCDSPSSDMPSSNTPPDDIELSPGAANENDERFI